MRRLGATLVAVLAVCAPAEAATVKVTPVRADTPGAKTVKESYVRVRAPLPEAAGPRPEACDWVGYLRFRAADGPRNPSKADAVGVFMPGYLAGAAYFDQVARNTIRKARKRGRFVEVWGIDRRSNCLEDHRGVRAAAEARDPGVAYDYYWRGAAVDGETFAGFKQGEDVAFLRAVGIEQTVRDWHTVITTGIPSQAVRKRKLFCGGQSLGGPITAIFAGWDFDGDPATRRDAGFRQCRAFVGFDTRFTLNASSGLGLSPTAVLGVAGDATDSSNENTPPLTPETFQLPSVFGIGAFYDPEGRDLLPELPSTVNIDVANKLLFSRNAVTFAAGPSIRDFNLTNDAVLAGVFDDNSAPLSFLRLSLGFLAGGPVANKDFPTPGDGTFGIPADPATPLYTWQDYDELGEPVLNDDGQPFTNAESEVSSLREFARIQFEAPANFIEQYFPRRLSADVDAIRSGDKPADFRYDGVSKRPAMLIQAGESTDNTQADEGGPIVGEPPNEVPGSRRITLPGYNHNDVLTAAERQNDGRPEPSSAALVRFMLRMAR